MRPHRSAGSRVALGPTIVIGFGLALTLGLASWASESPPAGDPSAAEAVTDQFHSELTTQFGLGEAEADCLVATFTGAGLAPEDLEVLARGATPDGVSPSAIASAGAEAANCLDDEEREQFLDKSLELTPPSAFRNGFITSFIASSPPGVTRPQAGCVYDALVASGLELTDFVDGRMSPEAQSALEHAYTVCGLNRH